MKTLSTVWSLGTTRALIQLSMLLVYLDLLVMTSWIIERVKVEALMDASISQMRITKVCKNAWQMQESQKYMLKTVRKSLSQILSWLQLRLLWEEPLPIITKMLLLQKIIFLTLSKKTSWLEERLQLLAHNQLSICQTPKLDVILFKMYSLTTYSTV